MSRWKSVITSPIRHTDQWTYIDVAGFDPHGCYVRKCDITVEQALAAPDLYEITVTHWRVSDSDMPSFYQTFDKRQREKEFKSLNYQLNRKSTEKW